MDDVVIFARAYEQRLLSRSTGAQMAQRGSCRPTARYTANGDSVVAYIGSAQVNSIFISDNGPPFYTGRDRSTT
jgi:hypothetical protein